MCLIILGGLVGWVLGVGFGIVYGGFMVGGFVGFGGWDLWLVCLVGVVACCLWVGVFVCCLVFWFVFDVLCVAFCVVLCCLFFWWVGWVWWC